MTVNKLSVDFLKVMGHIATVSVIDKDGDVGVSFEDGTGFVFHPACLTTVEKGAESHDTDSDEDDDNIVVSFGKSKT